MATTYIAKKPCRFGGKNYLIGEKIPGDKILSRRIGSLLRMGVIVEGEDEKVQDEKVPVVQKVEDEKVQKTKVKEEPKEKTEK